MLTFETVERLENFKFSQALGSARNQITPATEKEIEVLEALAETFGNPGWFEGHLATVVEAAFSSIIPKEADAAAGAEHKAWLELK